MTGVEKVPRLVAGNTTLQLAKKSATARVSAASVPWSISKQKPPGAVTATFWTSEPGPHRLTAWGSARRILGSRPIVCRRPSSLMKLESGSRLRLTMNQLKKRHQQLKQAGLEKRHWLWVIFNEMPYLSQVRQESSLLAICKVSKKRPVLRTKSYSCQNTTQKIRWQGMTGHTSF